MDLKIDETMDKNVYYKKITNDKILNITGEGGSGKSTLANQYKNNENYLVVDYDLILLDPPKETIEYELKQMLLNKYGKELFETINVIGLDKAKENFTTMYLEIVNYLSSKSKNKTIVLDGSQLRFIKDASIIKGEFVALRPSIQTCISQSVTRFIRNNPEASAAQIEEYTQKRSNILHQLAPMMNDLLLKVDQLPNTKDPNRTFDNTSIQNYLSKKAIDYLNIIKDEYSQFMSLPQLQFLNQLLTTNCIEVNENGKEYLTNQENEICTDPTISLFEKVELLRALNIPLAHGGRVFKDNHIHFYPSTLLAKNPNLTTNELMEKCEEVLVHELLHFFIRPEKLDITNFPELKKINNFTNEGLVDMCARDLQKKYNLFPDYTSDYGSNVIFVRDALSNISNLQEKMKLIFNGSIKQIYDTTSALTYNSQEEFMKARDKKTTYDEVIRSISQICYSEKKEVESCQKYLYNLSANFENKEKALDEIVKMGQQQFKDKYERIKKEYIKYQNIEQIKAILNDISTNNDYRNPPDPQDYLHFINQDEYDIGQIHQQREKELQKKLIDYKGKEDTFQKDCLYEYASHVIPIIKQDYRAVLSTEDCKRLDDLLKEKKIIIKEISQGTAHTNGQIEIPRADPLKPTFIKDVRYTLDTLLHEIFHQTHRYKVEEDLCYKVNGEKKIAQNYGGYLFEEGLTEKCTLDFARKHKLSCSPSYEYHKYVQLVACVQKNLECSNQELFNKDYREIFNKIDRTGNLLEQYKLAELSRYTSKLKKRNNQNKVEFDLNGKTYEAQELPSLQERKKESFDQRSQSELQIANQIRIKNQAIAQQKQIEKPQKLIKTNPLTTPSNKGAINAIILLLSISLLIGLLTMFYYYFLK